MSATLPYLFLDVDGVQQAPKLGEEWQETVWRRVYGVINPAEAHPSFAHWGGWAPPGKAEFDTHITVSAELFAALGALPAQVVLVSDWVARGLGRHFLEQAEPRWHYLYPGAPVPAIVPEIDPSESYGPGVWKVNLLRRILREAPRPFVWADDVEVVAHGRAIAEEFSELPQLQIAPDGERGLTRQHLADMRVFLEAQGG